MNRGETIHRSEQTLSIIINQQCDDPLTRNISCAVIFDDQTRFLKVLLSNNLADVFGFL